MQSANCTILLTIILLIISQEIDTSYGSPQFKYIQHINSPKDYVTKMKQSVEEHTVITEDGYVLTIHRIPGGPNSKPILVQHGLTGSSMVWLISGGKPLAYALAEENYDVWLSNVRGNTYGSKHLTLSLSDPQFWNFTFHEVGKYDLPAIIEHIKQVRQDKNAKIDYIGHSMGVTFLSVMASERPEYMKNIKHFIALAPAVFENNIRGLFGSVSVFRKQLKAIADTFGLRAIFSRGWLFNNFAENICTITLFRDSICLDIGFWINGHNPRQVDHTLIPVIWSIVPAGTSLKLFDHWMQQMSNKEFQQYDYGPKKNKMLYGNSTPPLYNFSRINVPVAMFYGDNDYVIHPKDALKFYEKVERKLGAYRIEDPKFSHIDFMWAKNAYEVLYKKIFELLRSKD